jgi:peptidoglycan/LPS O-acetylase OafA/YrhL
MPFTRKLFGPGLFRLFLATLVFFGHLSRYAFETAAVYVFFGLSGYWIYRMWTVKYSRTVNPYATYLISRAWRLIPTFALINALTIATEYVLGTSLNGLKGATSWMHFIIPQVFILGYGTLPVRPLGPAWSLDFEMQFYVIAPLLIIVMTSLSRPRLLLGVFGLLSTISAFWFGESVLTTFLIFFLVGMVAAETNWQPSGTLTITFCAIGLFLLIVCVLTPLRSMILTGAHPGPLSAYNHQASVIVALLAIPYAVYTTRQIGFELDGMFADLSYIVYLLHWAGVKCIRVYTSLGVPRIIITALVWFAVYGLAVAIWKLYDLPINKYRSKWVSRRRLSTERSPRALEAEPALR